MIIKYFAYYRKDAGCKEEILFLAPLPAIDLLRMLGKLHGDGLRKQLLSKDGEDVNADLIFLINGRNIDFLNGKDTLIESDAVVSLFPRIAGG